MNAEARPVIELGRFLTVAADRFAKGEEPAQMFSGAVSAAWHALRRRPRPYADFCLTHAGRQLGYLAACGRGLVNWIDDYERRFGPLPGVWFTDADGAFREDQWRRYQSTGQVMADWHGLPHPLGARTASTPVRVR